MCLNLAFQALFRFKNEENNQLFRFVHSVQPVVYRPWHNVQFSFSKPLYGTIRINKFRLIIDGKEPWLNPHSSNSHERLPWLKFRRKFKVTKVSSQWTLVQAQNSTLKIYSKLYLFGSDVCKCMRVIYWSLQWFDSTKRLYWLLYSKNIRVTAFLVVQV